MKTIAQQLNIKTFPFKRQWEKSEYKDGKEVYYENSDGFWYKYEYQDGNEIYYENSYGYIEDNRPKSKTQAKVEQARKLLEEAERELKEQS